VSIIAVVFWHNSMQPSPRIDFKTFYFIQDAFSGSFLRFCVPIFYLISGYLFFKSKFNYLLSLKKRLKSIVLPYFIWSLFGVVFIYAIISFSEIQSKMNLNWKFTVIDFLNHLILDPIQYQFWFLRDLMILAIISPVLYWLIIKSKNYVLIPLSLFWIYTGEATYIIRTESLIFFTLGAAISLRKFNLDKLKLSKIRVICFFILWCFLSLSIALILYKSYNIDFIYFSMLLCSVKVLGVIVAWFGYDLLSKTRFLQISPLMLKSTFFIFCFHEPVLTIFKKLSLAKSNEELLILLYFINPAIVIILSILAFRLMKKSLPKLTLLLTGYR